MKEWLVIQHNLEQCRRELKLFRELLDSKTDLEEARDVKPFFEAHQQLAVYLGSYDYHISRYDRLAYEYQPFGDFSCDLVVGDSVTKTYGFVEWEDATATSLFRQQGKKATPEWSSRFEHGYSQIIDWFGKLDDMAHTDEFETRFGGRHIQYFGLLVAGRDEALAHPRERRRWVWRSRKVVVNSLHILCVTYDQLYHFLFDKLDAIPQVIPSTDPKS